MAWDKKILPDAFLTSALAAVAAVNNGSKDNAFMQHIQTGIGTSWKRQFLRNDIVVFEGTGSGLIPYSGRQFTVPAVTKNTITSADINTGEWIHRIISTVDATKYIASLVTPAGGVGPGFLSSSLVSPNDVVWSTFVVNGPQFDTTNQSWLDLLYDGMANNGDLFDINSQPGGGSVAMNGLQVQFGGSYASGVSTAGIRESVRLGTGSAAFGDGMNAIVPWGWMYAGFGNTDLSAKIEYRRMFAQLRKKTTGQWFFLFKDARALGHETGNFPGNPGILGNQNLNYTPNSSTCQPRDGTGYEVWPEPSAIDPNIQSFYGKIDNAALQDFDCVCVGFQARIIDRDVTKKPVFLANMGWDIFRAGVSPRYDSNGYPYGAYDGGGGRWRLLPENGDWAWITAVGVPLRSGSDVIRPPWGNYEVGWLYNDAPNYGITYEQLQSSPPIDVTKYYNDTEQTTYSIEAIGDSLTQGNESVSNSYRTWRGTFQSLMAGAGVLFDMIGPRFDVPVSGGGDGDHAGWGGMGISSVDDPVNNATDRNSTIFAAQYQPNIVIIYLGWNALFNGGANATSAPTRYETYYNLVRSTRPNAKIVLCTLAPTNGETESSQNSADANYAALNTKIRALAAANTTTTIKAELAQIPYDNADWFDYVHMVQSGSSKQAQTIFDAIRAKGWF